MPRTARVVVVAVPHHVTQRGNDRRQIFFSDAQRRFYLALLAEHAARAKRRILGWCLMPNHVHLIAVPDTETSLAQGLGRAHTGYARWLNGIRRRSGHLFQNRFYSAPLDRGHLLEALRYVDLNPLRARLAERIEEYRWTSVPAHLTGADPDGLVDQRLWRKTVRDLDWAAWLEAGAQRDEQWERRYRAATIAGKPLGSNEFVAGLAERAGVSLELRGPGRPRNTPRTAAVGAGG